MNETTKGPLNPSAPDPAGHGAGSVAKAPSSRRPRLWIAGGVALLAAAAASVAIALRSQTPAAASPPIAPDVPRAEGTAIVFSPKFRERAGVKTVKVVRRALSPTVKVTGTVTFDPEHVAAVGTRIHGLVRRLVHIEGDAVKAGDLLAEIESAELGEAQAQVAMISAQLRAAQLNATRERDLASQRLSTNREAEVADATLIQHRAMLAAAQQKVAALGGGGVGALGVFGLRAPLAGTVVQRHISAGQSVEGNLVAYRIADLDHLWIELAVFERNLGSMHKGDAVEIHPLAEPTRAITGHLAYVGDQIDLTTRSADVRVKIGNGQRLLRPGQAVTAIIRSSGPAKEGLVVPKEAITFLDGKPTIFVEESENHVAAVKVELGATDGEAQEITSGLAEGASVVTSGVFALKSEFFR